MQNRVRRGLGLEDTKPGPRKALHRLLPTERQQVLDFARKEEFADLSHRILTVKAWEMDLFFVSFSSVYPILKDEGMMTHRGCHRGHNGRSKAPVRKELTGPNQRWCWDISYLYTIEKQIYLYLYLLLDKTVADEYFNPYFQWYNEEHYHSGIDYVTPAQAHQGLREQIISEREQKLNQQRQWRKTINSGLIRDPNFLQPLSKTNNQSDLCSVIHS